MPGLPKQLAQVGFQHGACWHVDDLGLNARRAEVFAQECGFDVVQLVGADLLEHRPRAAALFRAECLVVVQHLRAETLGEDVADRRFAAAHHADEQHAHGSGCLSGTRFGK